MAKRISIIKFKGGVGKTTLAFNLGAGLAKQDPECKVLLVDVDHQSSLSIVCMGADNWRQAAQQALTTDRIFRPFTESSVSMPGSELVHHGPIGARRYRSLYPNVDIVPASLQLDDVEIELTATHHGNAIQSEWDKRTLICRWLEESGIDEEYDYVVFDCPPATKIASQNAIAASHGYVIPVVPEAVMERGAPHLRDLIQSGIDQRMNALAALGSPRSMYVGTTQLVGVVVTRIKTHGPAHSGYTDDHTLHLNSLRRTWQSALIQPYIEDGTGISQALDRGLPVYDLVSNQNVGGRGFHRMYEQISSELKARIDAL